jgi:hypothetical protein
MSVKTSESKQKWLIPDSKKEPSLKEWETVKRVIVTPQEVDRNMGLYKDRDTVEGIRRIREAAEAYKGPGVLVKEKVHINPAIAKDLYEQISQSVGVPKKQLFTGNSAGKSTALEAMYEKQASQHERFKQEYLQKQWVKEKAPPYVSHTQTDEYRLLRKKVLGGKAGVTMTLQRRTDKKEDGVLKEIIWMDVPVVDED